MNLGPFWWMAKCVHTGPGIRRIVAMIFLEVTGEFFGKCHGVRVPVPFLPPRVLLPICQPNTDTFASCWDRSEKGENNTRKSMSFSLDKFYNHKIFLAQNSNRHLYCRSTTYKISLIMSWSQKEKKDNYAHTVHTTLRKATGPSVM